MLSTTYEQKECSETLAHKIQMLGNCPKETKQHLEQGENLKSRHNYLIIYAEQPVLPMIRPLITYH